jgi:ABC-type glycerol-3-phosphate transport system permease component
MNRVLSYRTSYIAGRVLLYLCILVLVLFILLPFAWILITSFQRSDYLMSVPPKVAVKTFNLDFYRQLFANQNFRLALSNSVITITISSLLGMVIAAMGGYVIGCFRIKRKSIILFILLSVQLLPAMVLLIPLFMILSTYQLVDTFMGLIVVYLAFQVPVGIWILRGFFFAIPYDLFEAAKIDGSSQLRVFFSVALPLARPGIISVGLFTFINGWNDLLIPLIVTVFRRSMLTVYAASFGGLYDTNYGGAAAVAILSAIPTTIIALIFKKQLVSGLTAGAIKG